MEITHSITYENVLVNHSQKLAIDMAEYFKQSRAVTQNGEDYAIDLIPVLTETGGGAVICCRL